MATYFVISDVHGFYNEMIEALDTAGYDMNNKNHILISLGDLCDRGRDAKACLEFINNIPEDNKVLILGNHEDLLEAAISRGYFGSHDIHNMTDDTVRQCVEIEGQLKDDEHALLDMRFYEPWNRYVSSCIDYYETDNYVFVHSFIPTCSDNLINVLDLSDKEIFDWRNGDWYDARWGNPFELWQKGKNITGKTIVCGHWHTSWAHSKIHHKGFEWNNPLFGLDNVACFDIFKDDGIIGIDACTAYSHKVNVLKIGNQKRIFENIPGQLSLFDKEELKDE